MCMSTPKMAPPKLPDPLPEPARLQDENVRAAGEQATAKMRAQKGAASTMLTQASSLDASALGNRKAILGA